MKIIIKTNDPEGLKKRIIADIENGDLSTWEIRSNKQDDKLLTHSAEQWVDRVLLRLIPKAADHQLLIEPRYWSGSTKPSEEDYGTVMGRFCERLFVNYASMINGFVGDTNK